MKNNKILLKLKNLEAQIGATPLIKINESTKDKFRIFIKNEARNPTGSIKDRTCLNILKNSVLSEDIDKRVLLDASSGNFASALAFMGSALEVKVEVVCSSKLTDDKKFLIEFFGANLTLHGDFTKDGNDFCRDLALQNERYVFLDQLHNNSNPDAHDQTTAQEIYDSLPEVKLIVGSLGSGGTMCGVARATKRLSKSTALMGVESQPGNKLPGVGSFTDGDYVTPFIREFWEYKNVVKRSALMNNAAITSKNILTKYGYFGPQTGALYNEAITYAREVDLVGDIVLIAGDGGWKNTELFGRLL